jgi:hypothetical protein
VQQQQQAAGCSRAAELRLLGRPRRLAHRWAEVRDEKGERYPTQRTRSLASGHVSDMTLHRFVSHHRMCLPSSGFWVCTTLEVHARSDGAHHGRAGSADRRVFLFPPSAFGTPALMCVCVCRPDCTAWRPGVVVRFSVLGSASGPAPEGAVGACRHARTLPYCPAGGVPRVCGVATSVPPHGGLHAIRPTAARHRGMRVMCARGSSGRAGRYRGGV